MKHMCPTCGVPFDGRREQVYCSRSCASRASCNLPLSKPWNKGKKGIAPNRPRTGADVECEHCGKSFYVRKGKLDSTRYCSMQCYLAARWGGHGRCANCGEPTTTRFCSTECQRTFWNQKSHESHQRRHWARKVELIAALGGKCALCGNSDMRVLDVHHIERAHKVIPQDRRYNWTRRFRDWEANKDNLELLCANCHRIQTWEQMGWGSGLEPQQSSVEQS